MAGPSGRQAVWKPAILATGLAVSCSAVDIQLRLRAGSAFVSLIWSKSESSVYIERARRRTKVGSAPNWWKTNLQHFITDVAFGMPLPFGDTG
jgi:hypothetical protein